MPHLQAAIFHTPEMIGCEIGSFEPFLSQPALSVNPLPYLCVCIHLLRKKMLAHTHALI